MTETINCPVCGREVAVEIENLEGDPISVDCKGCGASLKVSYEVSEIETDVTVETARFKCPECGSKVEVENPDENGSRELVCEDCPTRFKVEWSDWGFLSKFEVLKEYCPHCDEELVIDQEFGYRIARLKHLLDHALKFSTDLRLEDFAEPFYRDIASECEEDSWGDIAWRAKDEIYELIEYRFGATSTEKERGQYVRKTIGWLKSKYRSAFSRRKY